MKTTQLQNDHGMLRSGNADNRHIELFGRLDTPSAGRHALQFIGQKADVTDPGSFLHRYASGSTDLESRPQNIDKNSSYDHSLLAIGMLARMAERSGVQASIRLTADGDIEWSDVDQSTFPLLIEGIGSLNTIFVQYSLAPLGLDPTIPRESHVGMVTQISRPYAGLVLPSSMTIPIEQVVVACIGKGTWRKHIVPLCNISHYTVV